MPRVEDITTADNIEERATSSISGWLALVVILGAAAWVVTRFTTLLIANHGPHGVVATAVYVVGDGLWCRNRLADLTV